MLSDVNNPRFLDEKEPERDDFELCSRMYCTGWKIHYTTRNATSLCRYATFFKKKFCVN